MLSANGWISSMRVGLISLVVMAAYLILILGVHILARTFHWESVIDWNGLGVFLCAVGAFLTPVVVGKVIQKKQEKKMPDEK